MRKDAKNTEKILCPICKSRFVEKKYGKYKDHHLYKNKCYYCRKSRNRRSINYKPIQKLVCERCGFIPEDSCQLDVHHIDGNHENNSLDNLQILCANCHRLASKIQMINRFQPIFQDFDFSIERI